MILTYLRNFAENKNYEDNEISCNDIDFEITLSIIQTLFAHIQILDDLYEKKNPKQRNSYLIHSSNITNRYPNSLKQEAIVLKKQGKSYSEIAELLLKDPKLKPTIHKWVNSKQSFPVSETETSNSEVIKTVEALKQANVSFFDNVRSSHPSEIYSLYDLVAGNHFEELVIDVRTAKDNLRQKLKLGLPAFTVSGQFNQIRQKESLEKHTNFICIDIDLKDNSHIDNFKRLKEELKKITNISFIGKSVSGDGYYVIIPIKEPALHAEYFIAIEEAFKQLGIIVDKSCKDVCRLRIVSYDNNFYISKESTVINTVLVTENKKEDFIFIEHDRFGDLMAKINKKQIDITSKYEDWFAIACCLANTFGEQGREYFHSISKFYKGYNVKDADKQYADCLKNQRENGYTLGTLFHLANKYQIN
jgi:hypothetical protein